MKKIILKVYKQLADIQLIKAEAKKVHFYFVDEIKSGYKKYFFIFCLFFLFTILVVYRYQVMKVVHPFDLFFIYSTLTFSVLIIRYFGSIFHRTERWAKYHPRKWPILDIIIPAYNEGELIYDTVKSITKANYPIERLNIILVNDGSKDDTLKYINLAIKNFSDLNITRINFRKNRGKKGAMAEGIRRTTSEFVVFIDSDSSIDPDCLKEIIRPLFKDKRIGAVSGHALVLNSETNLLAKMQEIRYFNAFRSAKALESLLGFVSCCPGCCSAYRREAITPVIKTWLDQSFLGVKCTYGDDRSLTNLVLKNRWKAVYNEKAVVYTFVPTTFKKFNQQQLRWKKSWLRESVVVLSFIWKRNPFTAFLMIVDTVTPFFAPIIIARVLFVHSFTNSSGFISYLLGVLIFATCLGLFYRLHNVHSKKWWRGAVFSSIIALLTFWQLPYALMNLRDSKWGTR